MNFTFLSDIDGTLLKTNSPMPEATIKAAQAFVDAKGNLALCTGREIRSAGSIVQLLPVNAPCILYGGGMIYDFKEQKILWMQPLNKIISDVMNTILQSEPSVSITVFTVAGIHTIHLNRFMSEHGVYEDRNAPFCTIPELKGDILKVLLTCENPEILEGLRGRIIDPEVFEYAFAALHFYEITPKGVDKGTSMIKLAELMHMSDNHFFVSGDAGTDLTMRKNAVLFFAPETAGEIVRRSADYIVPGPSDAGMVQAFERAILYMEVNLEV